MVNFLKDGHICWFTDSQNLVRIVQDGSLKPFLQAEPLDIFL